MFTYDVWKTTNIDTNNLNSGNDVDNFKNGSKVAIKFQIIFRNFKTFKKIDAVKTFSFWLLGIYLIDNTVQTTVSTPEKRWWGENKWIYYCTQRKQ